MNEDIVSVTLLEDEHLVEIGAGEDTVYIDTGDLVDLIEALENIATQLEV